MRFMQNLSSMHICMDEETSYDTVRYYNVSTIIKLYMQYAGYSLNSI